MGVHLLGADLGIQILDCGFRIVDLRWAFPESSHHLGNSKPFCWESTIFDQKAVVGALKSAIRNPK
jgi:hypothetical protein